MARIITITTAKRCSSRGTTAALIVPLVVATGLAAGCGEAPGPEAAPAPETRTPSLELIARIGCADCDDERQITPTAVALLDGDRVAVLDSWDPFVRIFDATGAPELAFGHQGQGPGEFGVSGGSRPIPAAWILGIDGGVAVIDIFPPMLEVFDGSGSFREQHRLELPPVPTEQAFNAASRIYLRLGFDPVARAEGPGVYRCAFELPEATGCARLVGLQQFNSAPEVPGAPNADLRMVAIAATAEGTAVLVDRLTYRVWTLDETGEIIGRFGRDIPRRAKTAEEIEAERQRMIRPRPVDEIDPFHAHVEHSGLGVDGRNRIWALTTRWTDGTSVLDVFSPDGEYLGEAAAEAHLRRGQWSIAPFFMGDDRLAAIIPQADGSEQVWVWRILD